MKVSPKGISLIKEFEGRLLHAYHDIAGVLTIGYGHTGPDVHIGQIITEEDAEALLVKDLERFERCVSAAVTVPVEQHQFDAMVALAYNIGCSAFTESTFVRRLNEGATPEHAAQAWLWWNRAGGRVIPGLVRRRKAEVAVFLGVA